MPSDEPGTRVLEVIRTTEKVGRGETRDDPVHRHVQFFATDGELLAERCSMGGCGWVDGLPIDLDANDAVSAHSIETLADEQEAAHNVGNARFLRAVADQLRGDGGHE